jgi:MFS family permease
VAANLLGAASAAAAATLLLALAADCGLTRRWRWGLVALFALHPMVLGPAACGAPMALLTALLLGAGWALLRWSRTEGLRDLIAASLLLSGALITRYEAVFIVAGAIIYLGWRTWRQEGSWDKFEGTMITFGLPIAYVAGIWIIANWAIMGDPWYFVRQTFAAPGPQQFATPEAMATVLLGLGLVAFFPVLALLYHQMRGTGRHPAPARPVAWVVLTAMVVPVVFPSLFAGLGEDGAWADLLTPLAMMLAGGFAMLAAVLGDLIHGRRQHGPMAGTFLIAVASLGVAAWLWQSETALPTNATEAYLGRGPLAARATLEIDASQRLREMKLQEKRRHIVAGWPGFAVVLFAGRTGDLTVIRTEELSEYVDELWVGSALVLHVGKGEGAMGLETVEAVLDLPRGTALAEEWRTGPWAGFRVTRAPRGEPSGAAAGSSPSGGTEGIQGVE